MNMDASFLINNYGSFTQDSELCLRKLYKIGDKYYLDTKWKIGNKNQELKHLSKRDALAWLQSNLWDVTY